MVDSLQIIHRVIEEHHRIRENIQLAGAAINDMEGLFSLQRSYAGWTQSSLESLADKLKQLQQIIGSLNEGLQRHFSFEEAALPPLFGDSLMRALIFEHNQVRNRIGEVKLTLADTHLEGLKQEEMLSRKSHLQELINNACQTVSEHAAHEEIILNMIARTLEQEQKS
ncbi:MAG: hemerythrin domain-containing protein [Chloroflexota bacterium]